MSVRSGQSITTEFTTRAFATGAATDATGTPTGTLYVNGTSNAATVTVTNQATGIYKAAVTLPTLAVGDVVSLVINATVSGVTDNAKIWEDSKDVFAGAIPDVVAGGSGGLFISGSNTGTTTMGAFTVTGATTLTGAVSLGSTLGVTGTTTLAAVSTGAISTSGTVTFNAFTVTNGTTLSGAVSLGSTLGVTGTTTLAAVNTGAINTSGTVTFNAFTVTNGTTLSGAVSLGSTLGVTGTTTLAALNTGAISTSGTVTFNAFTVTNAFTVSGATTLTGAWTATNVSNNVTGIAITAASVDAIWDEPLAAHTTADTPGNVLNMLTQDTVVLSSDVALGSIVGQILDNGTVWDYDRATSSLHALGSKLPASLVSGRMDASVGAYQSGLTPLQPTTSGRTLDVTAAGNAGIDWANIENPTTAVNLSATNIDVDQVIASVSGNVGGNVTGSVGSVLGSVAGSVASVVGNVGGNVAGSVGSVTGLTNSTIATAVLTTAMTESYSADGAAATLAQASYIIMQMLTEISFSGTTATVKKLDGSTTAYTLTINNSSTPTSITRST